MSLAAAVMPPIAVMVGVSILFGFLVEPVPTSIASALILWVGRLASAAWIGFRVAQRTVAGPQAAILTALVLWTMEYYFLRGIVGHGEVVSQARLGEAVAEAIRNRYLLVTIVGTPVISLVAWVGFQVGRNRKI